MFLCVREVGLISPTFCTTILLVKTILVNTVLVNTKLVNTILVNTTVNTMLVNNVSKCNNSEYNKYNNEQVMRFCRHSGEKC